MNLTVIDIPGIVVNQSHIHLEHSTDLASVLVIKDGHGNHVTMDFCYGKITSISIKNKNEEIRSHFDK